MEVSLTVHDIVACFLFRQSPIGNPTDGAETRSCDDALRGREVAVAMQFPFPCNDKCEICLETKHVSLGWLIR